MNPQNAKLLAAKNAMHLHYVHRWRLWGLYHLQNLDRPAEYISPRQLREFSEPELLRLMKLVRGGV